MIAPGPTRLSKIRAGTTGAYELWPSNAIVSPEPCGLLSGDEKMSEPNPEMVAVSWFGPPGSRTTKSPIWNQSPTIPISPCGAIGISVAPTLVDPADNVWGTIASSPLTADASTVGSRIQPLARVKLSTWPVRLRRTILPLRIVFSGGIEPSLFLGWKSRRKLADRPRANTGAGMIDIAGNSAWASVGSTLTGEPTQAM